MKNTFNQPYPPREVIHRDGLRITDCSVVKTETALKTNDRGQTRNQDVFVGTALVDPVNGRINHGELHIVLALWTDVHHAVMTPQQAVELGKTLIAYGKTDGASPLSNIER